MIGNERVVSAVATLIGFGTAFLLTPTIWRERKHLDKHIVALWAMCFGFGLGSLGNTDAFYLYIGQITHIPNLSWLIVYSSVVTIVYCVLIITSTPLKIAPSTLKVLTYLTVIFLLAQTLLFFLGGIAFSPPKLVREHASSLSELVFLDAIYVFEIAIFLKPEMLFLKMFRRSRSFESRLRSITMFVVILFSLIYSLLRILSSIAVYYSLITDATLLDTIQMALWIAFAPALTLWPISFIPSQWFEFARKNVQLYYMRYLYRRVHDDCGHSLSIPWPGWLRQIQQASFYTNAISIFMLDVKWLVTKKRLVLNNKELANVIANLDENLPQTDFIIQCVIQSQVLKRQNSLRKSG